MGYIDSVNKNSKRYNLKTLESQENKQKSIIRIIRIIIDSDLFNVIHINNNNFFLIAIVLKCIFEWPEIYNYFSL